MRGGQQFSSCSRREWRQGRVWYISLYVSLPGQAFKARVSQPMRTLLIFSQSKTCPRVWRVVWHSLVFFCLESIYFRLHLNCVILGQHWIVSVVVQYKIIHFYCKVWLCECCVWLKRLWFDLFNETAIQTNYCDLNNLASLFFFLPYWNWNWDSIRIRINKLNQKPVLITLLVRPIII